MRVLRMLKKLNISPKQEISKMLTSSCLPVTYLIMHLSVGSAKNVPDIKHSIKPSQTKGEKHHGRKTVVQRKNN